MKKNYKIMFNSYYSCYILYIFLCNFVLYVSCFGIYFPVNKNGTNNVKETLKIYSPNLQQQRNKPNNKITNSEVDKSNKTIATSEVNKSSIVNHLETENNDNYEIPSGAILRGISVFIVIAFIFILCVACKTWRRKQIPIVKKYGIRTRRTDIEMEPLPLSIDDDDEDEVIFDLQKKNGHSAND